MSIVIIGGSNSIFRDGWISGFPSGLAIRNLSVGATTSICGLYRALLPDGPARGDTIIWEYALNEAAHLYRGYRLKRVLKNVEHLLRLASERRCRFVPLIFTPYRDEKRPERQPYFSRVSDLFRDYGLEPVDISLALRADLGVQVLPREYYSDGMHYVRSNFMLKFIGRQVESALPDAQVPHRQSPRYSGNRVVSLLPLSPQGQFKNSIMSVPVSDVPLQIGLPAGGEILAVVCLCSPKGNHGLRARILRGDEIRSDARFSTTSKIRMKLLKPVALENTGSWLFRPGDTFDLRAAGRSGVFYAEQGLKRRLDTPEPSQFPSVAGVLVEISAPPSSIQRIRQVGHRVKRLIVGRR